MTWKTCVYTNIILGLLYFVFDVDYKNIFYNIHSMIHNAFIFMSCEVAVLSPFFQDNCKNASN